MKREDYSPFVSRYLHDHDELQDTLRSSFTSVVTDFTLFDYNYEFSENKDRWKFFSRFSSSDITPDFNNITPSLKPKYEAFVKSERLITGKAVKRFCLRSGIEIGWGLSVVKVSPSFEVSDENEWYLPRRNDLIVHKYLDSKESFFPLLWEGAGSPRVTAEAAEISAYQRAETPLPVAMKLAWEDYCKISNLPSTTSVPKEFMTDFIQGVFQNTGLKVVRKKNMWGFGYTINCIHYFYLPHESLFKEQSNAFNSPLGQHSAEDVNSVGDYKFPLGALRQISDSNFGALVLHLHNSYVDNINSPISMRDVRTWARADDRLQNLIAKPVWNDFAQKSGMQFTLQNMLDFGRQKDLERATTKKTKLSDFVLGSDLRLYYDEWTWPYQRFFLNTHKSSLETQKFRNFVFRLDWVSFKEYLSDKEVPELQKKMLDHAYHPNSKDPSRLTVGWVRYTVLKENDAVVVDEVQSDLLPIISDPSILKGWDRFILWHFMMFVKKHLKYPKLLIPTSQTRRYAYKSLAMSDEVAGRMYDELPQALGAKRQLDITFRGVTGTFWVLK